MEGSQVDCQNQFNPDILHHKPYRLTTYGTVGKLSYLGLDLLKIPVVCIKPIETEEQIFNTSQTFCTKRFHYAILSEKVD